MQTMESNNGAHVSNARVFISDLSMCPIREIQPNSFYLIFMVNTLHDAPASESVRWLEIYLK